MTDHRKNDNPDVEPNTDEQANPVDPSRDGDQVGDPAVDDSQIGAGANGGDGDENAPA
jgi:hypothetical protein